MIPVDSSLSLYYRSGRHPALRAERVIPVALWPRCEELPGFDEESLYVFPANGNPPFWAEAWRFFWAASSADADRQTAALNAKPAEE